METPPETPADIYWAARSLELDRKSADLAAELAAAGIPSILLKGPALAGWLYVGRAVRTYGDTDLLVPRERWDDAMATLKQIGFEEYSFGVMAHPRMESFSSYPLARGDHNLDLHCTVWGIEVPPERAWEVLSAHTAPMSIGGRELTVLDLAARTMHVALHAAQHGYDDGKPVMDLKMALEWLPDELWAEAAEVAAELGALGGFATGLRLLPEGHALAERLGVDREATVDALLRAAHVPLSQGFEELSNTKGVRAKLAVIRGELAPTPDFMRWWFPLARRGRLGLAAAYLWRPLYLALRAGPGLMAWRRARRTAG